MSQRPSAERDRYHLARPIAEDFWRLIRMAAAATIVVYIAFEPDHRLAKSLLTACQAALTFISNQ